MATKTQTKLERYLELEAQKDELESKIEAVLRLMDWAYNALSEEEIRFLDERDED